MDANIYCGLDFDTQLEFRYKLPIGEAGAITRTVFDYLGVDLLMATSKGRYRHEVEARQIAMYILTLKTHASLKEIGRYFGGRDHSTVIYAKETVLDLMDTNKFFKHKVEEILALVSHDEIETGDAVPA